MQHQHIAPDGMGWKAFVIARDQAIRKLSGTVLEIGAGRGENFSTLPSGVQWIGLEPSTRLRRVLTISAQQAGHDRPPLAASAEDIPLDDASVDAVLATTVLCSVADQQQVLSEIERVLRPGGSVVLAEHVVADAGTNARRAQRLVRPLTKLFDHGCDPTRDTCSAVHHSNLELQYISPFQVPVFRRLHIPFVVIEARKPRISPQAQLPTGC